MAIKLERIFGPPAPPPVFQPTWGPAMATIWTIVIFVGCGGASIAAHSLGLFAALPDGKPDFAQLLWIEKPLVIVCVLVVASRLRSNPLDVLAFRRPAGGFRFIAITLAVVSAAALIALVVFIAVFLVMDDAALDEFLKDTSAANPNQDSLEQWHRRSGLLQSLVLLGVISPVAEEMLFRGFLLPTFFNTRLWFWSAAAITSVLFALVHNPFSLDPLVHVTYIMTGLFYAAALRFTGSLWMPIGLHVLKNWIATASASLS